MSKMYGAVESEEDGRKEGVVKGVDKNEEAAAADTWRPVAGSALCLFVTGLTASFLESCRYLVTECSEEAALSTTLDRS